MPASKTQGAREERAPDSQNRRDHARFAVELEVDLVSEHNFYKGFAENLSSGGVFIATHTPRAVGERLELTVHLQDADEPIRGTGEVRWIRTYSEHSDAAPGMGVKFVQIDSTAEARIAAFLSTREPLFHDED